MTDYLELPTMEVRHWLAGAARECGYEAEKADAVGYSAWWLENRGVRGVLRACMYLLEIHGEAPEHLRPHVAGQSFVCICPFEFAVLVVRSMKQGDNDFQEWTGGMATADPVLAAPLLTQMLDYKYNVHLMYQDQHLVFSQGGMANLSESLAGFAMTNTTSGVETSIRLVKVDEEEVQFTRHYERRDTLDVAKYRYIDGGGFRFN